MQKELAMKVIKKMLILWVVLFFYLPVYAGDTSSLIKKVTLFSDSALITREALVAVKKGENVFRISGLTPYFDDSSLHVEVKADFAKVLDVRIEKSFLEEKVQKRVKELKEKIKTIDNEIRVLNGEITAQEEYVEFLKKQKGAQQEFESFAKFIESSLKASYAKISDIEIKMDKLKEERDALEKEISNISSSNTESKIVTVILLAERDGQFPIELTYLTSNAGWTPQYDLRVDTQNDLIEIEFFAIITQKTNEDWNDISLELSTVRPRFGVFPDLMPWFLEVRREKKAIFGESNKLMMRAIPEGSVSETTGAPPPSPEVREDTVSFEFIIPSKVNIPADNQPYRIFLAATQASKEETRINYSAVPKLSPLVYLMGSFKNPYSFAMLPGKVNVFIDGKFVSSNVVKKIITPGEHVTVPLGVDDSIKVERKLKEKLTDHPGIISERVRTRYHYDIQVINGKSKDIVLDVKDAFPISRDDRIKVLREAPLESDAEISQDGIVTWKLQLGGKERKTLTIKFTVEYPKELHVEGLD